MVVTVGLIAVAVMGALAAGAFIYLACKLTVSFLKKYRKKKNSKVLAANVKDLMRNAPTMKFDDLEDDDIILAEYDDEDDELVQDIAVAKDTDASVKRIVNDNEGIVVFE